MLGERLIVANKVAKRLLSKAWWAKYIRDYERQFGIARKTRKRCDCTACNHKRKWEGIPMQERREILSVISE